MQINLTLHEVAQCVADSFSHLGDFEVVDVAYHACDRPLQIQLARVNNPPAVSIPDRWQKGMEEVITGQ